MEHTGSEHQITFMLDTRVSLEALVLNRLQRMPKTRRQEWLRGLVIQGFRRECQVINDMQPQAATVGTQAVLQTDFSRWLTQASPAREQTPPVSLACSTKVLALPAGNKPFANLRKVIG